MRAVQPLTPYGPRRCAHSSRKRPQRGQRPRAVAALGRGGDRAGGGHGALAQRLERRLEVVDPGDAGERGDRRVGVALADRRRQRARRARRSGRPRRARRRASPAAAMSPSTAPASIEVSWPGVADEDQPRAGPHRLDEPRHQRQRDHRGLVDDHDVVRQAVAAIVAEAAVRAGPPAEQAVQRARLDVLQAGGAHRVGQPGGGDGGRRRERDQRVRLLLEQQRDDVGDGRGLPGAGTAGDDREPAPDGRLGGERLARVGEPLRDPARRARPRRPAAASAPASARRSAATWRSSRQ